MTTVAAVDFGATSVRVARVDLDARPVAVDVVHRHRHEPVADGRGGLRWDWDRLVAEAERGLVRARQAGPLASIGVDTWGVDYGLIDAQGRLLSPPHCYRSDRTARFRASPAPGPSLPAPRSLPCIRKDFMVHPIQVLEARQAGASAILIIVRALDDADIRVLHEAARAAGLDALFEIHNEAELDRALAHEAQIIGVNNRDLAIFKCDLGLSERLIPKFPAHVTAVSESGIFTAADATRVRACGAHAILCGEALMKAPDTAALLADFHRA